MILKLILTLTGGIAIGTIITGIIGYYFGSKVISGHRAAGFNAGRIAERYEILNNIPEKLGDDYQKQDGYETLFTVKTEAVVIVERNGVKTLRAYRRTSETKSESPN